MVVAGVRAKACTITTPRPHLLFSPHPYKSQSMGIARIVVNDNIRPDSAHGLRLCVRRRYPTMGPLLQTSGLHSARASRHARGDAHVLLPCLHRCRTHSGIVLHRHLHDRSAATCAPEPVGCGRGGGGHGPGGMALPVRRRIMSSSPETGSSQTWNSTGACRARQTWLPRVVASQGSVCAQNSGSVLKTLLAKARLGRLDGVGDSEWQWL